MTRPLLLQTKMFFYAFIQPLAQWASLEYPMSFKVLHWITVVLISKVILYFRHEDKHSFAVMIWRSPINKQSFANHRFLIVEKEWGRWRLKCRLYSLPDVSVIWEQMCSSCCLPELDMHFLTQQYIRKQIHFHINVLPTCSVPGILVTWAIGWSPGVWYTKPTSWNSSSPHRVPYLGTAQLCSSKAYHYIPDI